LVIVKPSDLARAAATRAALAGGSARLARIATGLTQSDVARSLGVSRQAVGGWESGTDRPTAEHALAYGRLLAAITAGSA
jgi:DNA-binding XRE family transcriptional regulator